MNALIAIIALKYGFDPAFIQRVVKAESNGNPSAVSSVGAVGLMQLMPDTAKWLVASMPQYVNVEIDLFDPRVNLEIGVRYLHKLFLKYHGCAHTALTAYNVGPGKVDNKLKKDGKLSDAALEYSKRILEN